MGFRCLSLDEEGMGISLGTRGQVSRLERYDTKNWECERGAMADNRFGVFVLAYHLGVTAVRAITNAFNCGEDLSSSLVVKEICAAVNTDSPGNLPSVLVSIRAGIPNRIKDN